MASLESYTPCLLGAMDRLWFQKTVLISEPISSNKIPVSKNNPNSSPKSHSSSSLFSAPTDCSDEIITEDFSHGVNELLPSTTSITQQSDSEDEDDKMERLEEEKEEEKPRPTRPNVTKKKIKPSSTPIRRRIRTRIRRLERTRSCMSSAELEEEEVKGFMDLGFIFDKERLTPKMRSMIPGLQRLEVQEEEPEAEENGNGEEDAENVGEAERRRPYLQEGWLIRRLESPIVMMRMPIINAPSDDMKKHIKHWAKTVAVSAVQHA